MSRIHTNVQALLATRVLHQNNASLDRALSRISTGLRINTGKDDPAGLIASEALRQSKVAIAAAIDNANRASNIVAIAEGGLQEINALLLEMENLVDRSANEAGLSPDEVKANQLQIDSILQSINRISDTTEFAGKKLLNGNFAFTVSGTTLSDQRISDIRINAAKIPEGATRTVTVQVLSPSEFAHVSATGGGAGGALSAASTLQVRGNFGTEVLSFASGTTLTQMATAVNASTQLTGVSAAVSGANVVFTSTAYGSEAMVSVERLTGQISVNGGSGADDNGADGEIVVNGAQANVSGLDVSARSGALSADLVLAATFASQAATAPAADRTASFEITGGGAVFAISPTVGLVGQETLGIKSLSSGSLGNGVTGYLSSLQSGEANDLDSGKFATAQRIVRAAIDQVSSLRGRVGAFQKDTLASTINSLGVTAENTAAAESAIRDADFAVETSNLTRYQILVQTATAALQLANAGPQNVLALLG
ncbi:MAG: flagellin N-terminal helical domain-containing protein [Planctomycetota bacterium]|jgi:flagellin